MIKTDANRRTLVYYLLFIGLGLNAAVLGPTLPALAQQTSTPVGQLGLLFLGGSVGYTLGTFLGGRIFDRVRGHPVLGIAQLAVALLLVLIPNIPWLWALFGVIGCKGLADGFINTGANTLLVWTHKDKVGPYMNGLHFFFGLGAFLAPLFVAQGAGVVGGYRWVYWILAGVALLIGLRILTVGGNPEPIQQSNPTANDAPGLVIHYPFIIAAALLLFFYVGAEVAFGGWIYTYAVTLKLASASEAAYLTSGFWLSFTIGRLLSIPLATRFIPQQIIAAAIGSCLAVLALLIGLPGSGLVLWVGVLGLGFCMAPIFATGFTLAGQSLRLTARVSGLILLGDSFGGMLLPWLVGAVLEALGPTAMIYLVFSNLVCTGLAFAVMLRLRPSH